VVAVSDRAEYDRGDETDAIVQSPELTNRRLGPHYVPRIECGRCGRDWHIDAGGDPCPNCSAFLREPTNVEIQQFADWMDWNHRHELRDQGGENRGA